MTVARGFLGANVIRIAAPVDWGVDPLASANRRNLVVRGDHAVGRSDCSVVVIDDDVSVRKALRRVVRSIGLTVSAYGSAEEFLAAADLSPACLILDVRLPGMSGLDLQRLLAESGRD